MDCSQQVNSFLRIHIRRRGDTLDVSTMWSQQTAAIQQTSQHWPRAVQENVDRISDRLSSCDESASPSDLEIPGTGETSDTIVTSGDPSPVDPTKCGCWRTETVSVLARRSPSSHVGESKPWRNAASFRPTFRHYRSDLSSCDISIVGANFISIITRHAHGDRIRLRIAQRSCWV